MSLYEFINKLKSFIVNELLLLHPMLIKFGAGQKSLHQSLQNEVMYMYTLSSRHIAA